MVRWMTTMMMTVATVVTVATPAVAADQTGLPTPTEQARAVQDLELRAKGGGVESQYALGMLKLADKNESEAESWLLAAAQRRYPPAQLALARLYTDRAIANGRNGMASPFDGSNAYYWLLIAEHFITAEPDRASARQLRDRLAPTLPPDLLAQIERSTQPAFQEMDGDGAAK